MLLLRKSDKKGIIMKRNIYMLLLLVSTFIFFASCSKTTEPEINDEQETENNVSADTSEANSGDHEDEDDYVWNDSDVIPIELNGTSITENTAGAEASGGTLLISSAGTYSLSGTLTDGQIIVSTEDEAVVRIILNSVNITCSSNAPIYIKKSMKTVIVLADNSDNTLTDGNTYVQEDASVDEPNAALYSKSDLTIFGNGSLNVTGNYNDAIASADGLIIKSGNISVSSADDGIRGKDYLIVKDGSLTVNVNGDGLKSDNSEDATKGYVSIENGEINITSGGDGIAAETDAIIYDGNITISSGGGSSRTVSGTESAKGIKGSVSVTIDGGTIDINSADDGIHSNAYVTINNGTVSISTGDDGIHADAAIKISNGDIKITKSIEGIEAKYITVNNGNISIVSTDDGFNATTGNDGEMNDGSCLYLNGGSICVNSSRGDGLDSNGNIVMSDGTVVVHGPISNPEVGTDYNGSFNISGGLLVITGPNSGNMIEATSTTSGQYAVKAISSSQISASNLFHIQDENGNNLVTFEPVRNCYYIVFSSSDLKNGSTYYIYTGGTSTGVNTNGLYSGGTYSGGILRKNFTISGKVTSVSF